MTTPSTTLPNADATPLRATTRTSGSRLGSALLGAVVAVALCLAAVAPAHAQSPDELVQQATEYFQAEDYGNAIELFERAFELDPHPVIMFNLARAYQEAGDLPAALLSFRNIRTMSPPEHVGNAAEDKIVEIEGLLQDQGYDPNTVTSATYRPRGTLTVTTQPEGALVYLDGQYQGSTPFQQELVNQGIYALRIELDGFHPVTQDVEVRGLRNNLRSFNLSPRTSLEEYVPPTPGYLTVRAPVSGLEVQVDGEFFGYTPVLAQGLAPGTYTVSIDDSDWRSYSSTIEITTGQETQVQARMAPVNATEIVNPYRGRRTVGTVLMVTGAAALAGGAAFGIVALNNASEYRDNPTATNRADLRDSAQQSALIADIAFASGGVLVLTGALLRWVGTGPPDDVDRGLLVRPSNGPGLGFGLHATW